jgi:hypothetical protein
LHAVQVPDIPAAAIGPTLTKIFRRVSHLLVNDIACLVSKGIDRHDLTKSTRSARSVPVSEIISDTMLLQPRQDGGLIGWVAPSQERGQLPGRSSGVARNAQKYVFACINGQRRVRVVMIRTLEKLLGAGPLASR